MPVSLDVWLTFVTASLFILAIPGPTVLLLVTYALTRGRSAALPTIVSVALGDVVALLCTMAGLGALLAASASAFSAMKWLSAVYLLYLGIKMWRAPAPHLETEALPEERSRGGRQIFWHGFIVTALNPKTIAFFVAFLPQFVTAEAPLPPQMAQLGATFLVLAVAMNVLYVALAGRARRAFRSPRAFKLLQRLGGGVLIIAAAMMAGLKRA